MLKIIKGVAFVTYKEWAAYRSHMLVSLILGPLYFLVQYYIWTSLYNNQDLINGFTLSQMLTYYGITTLIHYCIMDFADWNLQMLIRTGRFITFILRPVSHRLFALSQKIGHRILGFHLEFIPVYMIFFFFFDINLIPANIFWFAASIILGFMMQFLLNYCIGMTAFWLTRADGVRSIYSIFSQLSAGVLIPLTFFPEVFQRILFFLPFQFISYVPVNVFLGEYKLSGIELEIPQIVGIQFLYVIIIFLFSELIWRRAIIKYTGVGV
ncbi:ABC transporter permease [Natronospora cellulosivora (SeqCode)]